MEQHGRDADGAPPTERVLDLLLYAPLGLVLEAGSVVPRLAARGRQRFEGQVRMAQVVGRFAVDQGRRVVEARATAWRRPDADLDASAPSPAPGEAPVGEPTSPGPRVGGRAPGGSGATSASVAGTPPAAGAAPSATDGLAIPEYDSLAASQVVPRLVGLDDVELEAVRRYELAHRARRTILARVAQLQAER